MRHGKEIRRRLWTSRKKILVFETAPALRGSETAAEPDSHRLTLASFLLIVKVRKRGLGTISFRIAKDLTIEKDFSLRSESQLAGKLSPQRLKDLDQRTTTVACLLSGKRAIETISQSCVYHEASRHGGQRLESYRIEEPRP
jgi:hypothetical protein